MAKSWETIGSDENSLGKSIHFLALLITLAIFNFALANLTQPGQQLANFFLLFSIVSIAAILYDIVSRQSSSVPEVIDTVTVENKTLFGPVNKHLTVAIVSGSLVIGGLIFLLMGERSALQLVSAPLFQLISPGAFGNALLSGLAGISENMFFFGFLEPTMFVFLNRAMKGVPGHKFIAAALVVFIGATLFMLYHWGVYGDSAQTLDTVFFFGLLAGGLTVLTGNLVPAHSLHFWNNFGVTYFTLSSADVFLWVVLYWVVIAAASYAYLRRR